MSDVNPCFSQDIWFEIHKNLPVKTLGKCRCVCKSWHSLITSSTFITTHLNNYTRNNTNTILVYRKNMSREVPNHEQYLFFLDTTGRIPFQLFHTSNFSFKLHDLPIRQSGSFFVGSVHGLLCLSDKPHISPTKQIMLWNPFLRKIINLPTSSLPATSDLISVLGFGYDSNKKDHRVVKISYSGFDNYKGFNPLVEVYSVWERIWKTIPADYLADNSISSVSFSHCFLNGVIHWLAFETGPFNYVAKWVLLFNVVEETFQKIELPDAMVKMLTGTPDLFVYKTKLSLLHCEDYECDISSTFAKCQIWVKEEEESCWCMILNITVNDDHYLLSQVSYLDKDGKLFGFVRKSDRVMVLYDVSKRQFIELGLHYSYDASSKFASFTDSLVLLDHQETTDLTEMMHSKCTSTNLQLEMN